MNLKSVVFLIGYLSFAVHIFGQNQDSIEFAASIIGLSLDQSEIDSLRPSVRSSLRAYEALRAYGLTNEVSPSIFFQPNLNLNRIPSKQEVQEWNLAEDVAYSGNIEEVAFYPVYQLAVLLRKQKITSLELTKLYLDRLRKYGDTLQCVITITDSVALAQAKRADREIQNGNYKGPLHGIPYGIKDLLATPEYKTTWGAMPYKDQIVNVKATVVQKLEDAGAVLIAKLTLGALAWGDVWYGGVTKNPWNLEQGSSGSSAGSASATVAGLVPFAIGSETLGSIVSPSTRCGATGLRPTYGRVSRYGAMALSWSMDKLGPICRNAIDAGLVLEVIRGSDDKDLAVRDFPFNYKYSTGYVKSLKVGYLKSYFNGNGRNGKNDSITISLLRDNGIALIEKNLPEDIPTSAMRFILSAEAAAAFDELTRSNMDSLLVRQIKNAWPNVFRAARFIPAVEYINANRLRTILIERMNEVMKDIDVLIAPSFAGPQLTMTNLSGHPCVVLPNGSYKNGDPGSITLLGNHFDEAAILAFARYLQELTPYDAEYPEFFMN